jgi:hypothetical protein
MGLQIDSLLPRLRPDSAIGLAQIAGAGSRLSQVETPKTFGAEHGMGLDLFLHLP